MGAELDAMSTVADRLVGGMMFHSDHADLMTFLGFDAFADIHEDGFRHDSRSLRKVRGKAILHLGMMPQQGRQERGGTLDKVMAYRATDLSANDRYRLVTSSLEAWADWERETASVFGRASESLDGVLWKLVTRLQRGAESECAEATRLLTEARACDVAHLYDMNR